MYYHFLTHYWILGIGLLIMGCQLEESSSASSSQEELQGDTVGYNRYTYDSLHALYLLLSLIHI